MTITIPVLTSRYVRFSNPVFLGQMQAVEDPTMYIQQPRDLPPQPLIVHGYALGQAVGNVAGLERVDFT